MSCFISRNKERLESVQPEALRQLVEGFGWKKNQKQKHCQVYAKLDQDEEVVYASVYYESGFVNYHKRVYEVLKALEDVEDVGIRDLIDWCFLPKLGREVAALEKRTLFNMLDTFDDAFRRWAVVEILVFGLESLDQITSHPDMPKDAKPIALLARVTPSIRIVYASSEWDVIPEGAAPPTIDLKWEILPSAKAAPIKTGATPSDKDGLSQSARALVRHLVGKYQEGPDKDGPLSSLERLLDSLTDQFFSSDVMLAALKEAAPLAKWLHWGHHILRTELVLKAEGKTKEEIEAIVKPLFCIDYLA